MIITSHMNKNIQMYPCFLKLSRKQEVLTWKYLKQGFWGEILVFGWKITDFDNCVLFTPQLSMLQFILNLNNR
jgi:hypothetical protein